MFLSIITPTLLRPSLCRTVEKVAQQTRVAAVEMLIGIDVPMDLWTIEQRELVAWLISQLSFVRLTVTLRPHANDFGHSMRAFLSRRARGEYILYHDDDDYLEDPEVVETLEKHVTADWAIFPVLREYHYFFSERPARCSTTLSSWIAKRDLALFPFANGQTGEHLYQLDADLLESLIAHGAPQIMRDRPLVSIPRISRGER